MVRLVNKHMLPIELPDVSWFYFEVYLMPYNHSI
jgi:hypothetical protein